MKFSGEIVLLPKFYRYHIWMHSRISDFRWPFGCMQDKWSETLKLLKIPTILPTLAQNFTTNYFISLYLKKIWQKKSYEMKLHHCLFIKIKTLLLHNTFKMCFLTYSKILPFYSTFTRTLFYLWCDIYNTFKRSLMPHV